MVQEGGGTLATATVGVIGDWVGGWVGGMVELGGGGQSEVVPCCGQLQNPEGVSKVDPEGPWRPRPKPWCVETHKHLLLHYLLDQSF